VRAFVCFPSINADRARTATERWHARGYEVAVWVEGATEEPPADLVVRAKGYPGYWGATNLLARQAVAAGADTIVAIGDDMDPDPRLTGPEIAAQFLERFRGGLGIMQPTGDPMDGTTRICGSPWMGRAWVERAYRGSGPLWPEYRHYYGDEELLHVARRLGVLWQRADLTQWHHHWCRSKAERSEIQPYQRANSDRWWAHDQAIFRRRKAAAFPCAEVLDL
jgi:hypothetical protein